MKTKKLSKGHFRYLLNRVIKNPMIYINDFFRYQTSINHWMKDVNLMINAGTCSSMACPAILENGFHCKQMIEQVEVAYVIYKQCGLKKQDEPLSFFKTREDYFNYSHSGEYTSGGEVDPEDTLSKFFSYQSLSQWYVTLDDLMEYLTCPKVSNYDRFGDKIVVIKELLFRLSQAIYAIYEAGGIPVKVPSYFIAKPTTAIEGKMPRSKLGEYLDNVIDEQHEKLAEEQRREEESDVETKEMSAPQDE